MSFSNFFPVYDGDELFEKYRYIAFKTKNPKLLKLLIEFSKMDFPSKISKKLLRDKNTKEVFNYVIKSIFQK